MELILDWQTGQTLDVKYDGNPAGESIPFSSLPDSDMGSVIKVLSFADGTVLEFLQTINGAELDSIVAGDRLESQEEITNHSIKLEFVDETK